MSTGSRARHATSNGDEFVLNSSPGSTHWPNALINTNRRWPRQVTHGVACYLAKWKTPRKLSCGVIALLSFIVIEFQPHRLPRGRLIYSLTQPAGTSAFLCNRLTNTHEQQLALHICAPSRMGRPSMQEFLGNSRSRGGRAGPKIAHRRLG